MQKMHRFIFAISSNQFFCSYALRDGRVGDGDVARKWRRQLTAFVP